MIKSSLKKSNKIIFKFVLWLLLNFSLALFYLYLTQEGINDVRIESLLLETS